MFSRHKFIPILIGLLFVVFAAWLQITTNPIVKQWLDALNHLAYDVQLRIMYGRPALDPDSPIVIVAIDDKSLAEQGRWPWPRNKLGMLINNLESMGAAVIAIDMTFPEPEPNIAQEILTGHPNLGDSFKTIIPEFDYDQQFANNLKKGETVLGITLSPDFKSYTGNIPLLQTAAKGVGFVNAFPDDDGVMRRALLVAYVQNKMYASLALEAIRRYTFTDKIELVTALQGKVMTLQGIKLGEQTILTDAEGRVLIPFRGTAYSFPYFSATDVLAQRIAPALIKDKLVFIGATAFGLGDTHATSVQSVYPGVEVHASVAAGILNNNFPTRPAWAPGAELSILILIGMTATLLFPFLGILFLSLTTILFSVAVVMLDNWLWQKGIILSVLLPVTLILLLAVFNTAYGYLFENRRREQLKSMFGRYVPSAHIDAMLLDPSQYGFQGQSKEMTVLFADIRNFTALSENMTATQLKDMLNQYLTPMTQILFKHHGTIDKYVGDMVMAFWNAPLPDVQHARHAILAALDMQDTVANLQSALAEYTTAPVHIGIGINTGAMSVGDMGSEFRRAYTVLGDTVNLASRLEGQTKYYGVGIIVGEETYEQTKSDFLFRQLDRIKVKGKEKGIAIYQPICLAGNANAALIHKMQLHNQAMDAYFAQQWDVAEATFRELALQESDQKLYAMYIDRLKGLRQDPPGGEWDGAYVSHEK